MTLTRTIQFTDLSLAARLAVRHVAPLLALLGLATLLGPGCAPAGASQPAPAAAKAAAVAVTTAPVVSRQVAQTLTLTGTLTANRKSEVAADASGKVAAALVERGAVVAAGTPLVRLDRRSAALAEEEARAQADAARTQHALAETECARAEKLWAAGAINQAEHERVRAGCAAARQQAAAATARARLAGKNVGDAVVRAPFRGLVADRFVTEGEYVRPDTRVATLVEVDPLRLELSVPEAAIGALRAAAEVRFEVAAFPGETFTGKVRYIGPAVRRQSRDLLVEAVVANRDRRLLPGMFASARLVTGAAAQAVVPAAAVKRDGEVDRVFVVSAGHVQERLVSLGARQGDDVAVLSGLRAGEQVVAPLSAASNLRDGAAVAAR